MKPTVTLKHLASRLHEQTLEVAALRAALAVQVARIVRLEAELEPHAMRALFAGPASGTVILAAVDNRRSERRLPPGVTVSPIQ
jgi:hypothetical protein